MDDRVEFLLEQNLMLQMNIYRMQQDIKANQKKIEKIWREQKKPQNQTETPPIPY